MAVDPRTCTVSKCQTIIDERALTAGGDHFLFNQWVTAYRAATTTKCQAHYLDTDIPTVYAAYVKGSQSRGNREKA